ncbi:MAG TPA: hypothetical protein K8V54_03095 [Corynebacterium kroppenstedtii]|nr:hypothetical protein [Corynebacterium kroppenstedtii]
MKLKKSLLALSTAAAIAVSGSAVAVAENNSDASLSSTITTSLGSSQDETTTQDDSLNGPSSEGEASEGQNPEGSNFFGDWEQKTGLEKLEAVVKLIGIIAGALSGIVGIAAAIMKLVDTFQK